MKIAFRISTMGHGGAERVFLSVAKVLKRDFGFEVDFVVDKLIKGKTEAIVTEQGYHLYGLSCTRTLKSVIPLKNYIDEHKPDVIISAYTDTNMAAVLSTKLAKHQCRLIVSEHASLAEHWQNHSTKRKVLLNLYVKYGYRFADHILAVSKGIALSIQNIGHAANNVSYIYNPVRFNALVPKADQSSNKVPTILAVGRVAKQKDYATLLQAFNLLNQTQDARLVIVGAVYEQDEKNKLDQYLSSKNLSEKVTFVDFTENIQDYYAMADLFVLSSAWEGFGNVIVEALAFGLPIVSTNCNYGPAEILEDGKYGQLVPVGDYTALSIALAKTLNQLGDVDSERLMQRSLDFSEENIGQQYFKLIKRVVSR